MKASVHVYATQSSSTNTVLRLTTSKKTTIAPTCTRISSGVGCNLKTVNDDGFTIPVTITIPKGTTTGGITFTAAVSATGAAAAKDTIGLTVAKASSNKTSSGSGDSSGGSGSGGGSGSSGSSGGSNSITSTVPGSGAAYVPPNAAGALSPAGTTPSAQFPQIAPQNGTTGNAPVVAGQAAQNVSALRSGSPEPQELTFQRLASTQAAWLAALLVAFSLLLTHIRLNKPAAARRRKGVHRRERAGIFQA